MTGQEGQPLSLLVALELRGSYSATLEPSGESSARAGWGRVEAWLWEQRELFRRAYAAPGGREAVESVICYLREVAGDATEEVVVKVLRCFLPEQRTGAIMQTVADRLRIEGEARGLLKGRVEGKVEGKAEGKAEAVLQVLALRGVYVDSRSRQRILRCEDVATLDLWLARAVQARQISDVLGPPRSARHSRRR